MTNLSESQKYRLTNSDFSIIVGSSRSFQGGGSRSSRYVERDAVDADGAIDEQRWRRTAKSCGPDASRSALTWRTLVRPATVSTNPDRRGEHEVAVKTIVRGMSGETDVTVVTTLVCFLFLHARLRAHQTPGIPCALWVQKAG